MKTLSLTDYRVLGDAILERFDAQAVPKPLVPHLKTFVVEHRGYTAASARVDDASSKKHDALEAVGAADAQLDHDVLSLADRLVAAALGERKNPFAKFSKLSPSAITDLSYANEVDAVRTLGQAIAKVKPPADVTKALSKCLASAGVVQTKLKGLSAPQVAYAKALSDRDESLARWMKALARLKLHAQLAYEDDPATFKALFAKPDSVARPTSRPHKGKPAPAPAPVPPQQ